MADQRLTSISGMVGGFRNKFTSAASGSFTVPASVRQIYVVLTGGGGGGSGGRGNGGYGGGGGSGGCTASSVINVVPGEIYTYTVGAGGDGGAVSSAGSTTMFAGGSGGNSSVYPVGRPDRELMMATGGPRGNYTSGGGSATMPRAVLSSTGTVRGGRAGNGGVNSQSGQDGNLILAYGADGTASSLGQNSSRGVHKTSYGSGGGGGGSSYYGKGGDGGNGGGDWVYAEAGFTPDASNYGAGGGGGGGGDTGSSKDAGGGGNGISGFIEIWY